MLNSLFNFLIKRSALALALLLIVVGTLLSQIPHFSLDASSDSLALEGDNNLALFEKTQETFQISSSLIISYTTEDGVLDPQQIEYLRALRDDLLALERVESVTSILDVPLFQSPPLSLIELTGDAITIDNGKADMAFVANEFGNGPLYSNNLVSLDGKTSALLIDLKDLDESTEDVNDVLADAVQSIRTIMEGYRNNAQLYLGGVPMIRNDIIAYIASDLVLFSLAVVLIMSIMLAIIFRGIRWVLLPIGISVAGALVMTGVLGALEWKVTIISSNFFSLLLVMTLSVTIHLVVRFKELAQQAPEADVKDLTLLTLQQMSKPCLFTTLTTIAAFASLMISDVRPVIDFGWMMAIGVTIALALSFLTFPILMNLLPAPKVEKHPTEFTFTQKLAHFTSKYGNQLIIALTLIAIIALIGVSKLSVENRFIDYFKKSTEIYQGLSLIDQQLGGTMSLEIIFDDMANAFWVDDLLREDVHNIHQYLDGLDATGKVLSIDTLMQILTQANAGVPPTGFLLMVAKNQMPEFAREQVLDPYLSESENQLRMVARIRETDSALNRDELINEVRAHLVNEFNLEPDSFRMTGVFVLYNNLLQSLFESQIKTIALVFAMIFAMFLFIFRSISLSIIALIPNTLPSLLILGIMGLANIPLDLMTITIAAIAVGIGVDNAIHYIHRFKKEFRVDQDYLATMYRSHASIGLAMFYTSITVAIGFLVLALSNFIPSIYFGIFTAIAMLSAVLANLTLLPKLLLIFKPKMGK
jgi:predicted RND superfamily exporter protein